MNKITSTQQFEQEVLNSTHPVFVDFWVEWCGDHVRQFLQ
jgi:thioredoxin-like negative regulator of GroEL